MRRILLLLTVVALMTVMLAMSVAPAFAQGRGFGESVRECVTQEECRALFLYLVRPL